MMGVERPALAYVTQWFTPEGPGPSNWIPEALVDRGWRVGVVTGTPHYPLGRTYEGFRACDWRLDRSGKLMVVRVPEYPSHDSSAVRRMMTLGSFAISSSLLATRTIAGADVSLVYSSPATSALAAMCARYRYGSPYVLYIQDLWPDSVYAAGVMSAGVRRRMAEETIGRFVDHTYAKSSHIAVISPGMKELLVSRGVPARKISVVYNWVDEDAFRPVPPSGSLRSALGLADSATILLFAGNHGKVQGLPTWLEAMGRVRDLPDVHLVFIGDGLMKAELRDQAAALQIDSNVHFLDPVPASQIAEFGSDADFGVVSLLDDPLYSVTLPSKTQAILAQGKPILTSAPGDSGRLVEANGAGWACEPDHVDLIAEMIRTAAAAGRREWVRRGQAGRQLYEREMSREVGSERLARILRAAIQARGDSAASLDVD